MSEKKNMIRSRIAFGAARGHLQAVGLVCNRVSRCMSNTKIVQNTEMKKNSIQNEIATMSYK